MAGLFLANPNPQPIGRDYSTGELKFAAYTGVALAILGLTLTGFAIYITGAFSGGRFFHDLDTFRRGSEGGPGPTGGFFYRGADIAVFGMALILPSCTKQGAFFRHLARPAVCVIFSQGEQGWI